MKLTESEKVEVVKAFTEVFKCRRGRGPKNIYLKVYSDEMRVYAEGVLSEIEKYIIKTFGEEQRAYLERLWRMDVSNIDFELHERLEQIYGHSTLDLELDLENDRFIYIMKQT